MAHCPKRKVIVVSVFAAVAAIVPVAYFHRDVATWYVARQLRMANSPDSELRACVHINHLSHVWTYGYRVEAEDTATNEIKPWETGDYESVAAVRITWDNGVTVRRVIVNRRSREYVLGE